MKLRPYKLNIGAMKKRLAAQKSYDGQIRTLRNLMTLKKSGFIPVSDLVQLAQSCPIPPEAWTSHTRSIRKAESLILYGELITFYERCGMIRVTARISNVVNEQLDIIYRQ